MLRTGKGSAQPPSEKMELAVKSVHGRKAVFATLIGCGEAPEVRFSEMISEKDGTCGMRVAVNGKSYSLTVNRINRTACIDVGE